VQLSPASAWRQPTYKVRGAGAKLRRSNDQSVYQISACSGVPYVARYLFLTYYLVFSLTHICHLTKPGRESSGIEVEYILDNRLLFDCSELMPGITSFWAIRGSVVLASYCCMRYVERLSSASEALKLMCSMGRKSKLNSAFSVRRLCVLLLRHVMLIRD
jgi:hypothetical protein